MQGLGLVILSQHLEAKGPCFTKLELNLPTCLALCVISKLPGPLCPQVPAGRLPARSSCLSLPPAFFLAHPDSHHKAQVLSQVTENYRVTEV